MSTTIETNATGIPSGKLGIWLFLASEVMFFTGLLGAAIVLRAGYPGWKEAAHHLNVNLAAFNTFVLLTSSLTMALAVAAVERKDLKNLRLFLGITILLGLAFLGIKGIEYADKFAHNHTPGHGLFWDSYFMLTGFHGLHVIGGAIANLWVLILTFRRDFFDRAEQRVEQAGLYWHFVDVVWIFLFPILYLI
ncbi:MAG: hypothetical protein COV76_00215 [Candidatus Omnitrophica bacterium CG11_big_fil_rev_8_21_14_0_20_64_10]|nr:MAG: hypothetical protein COV76_00215 [Candidatus Omnitrophica bacterium CG11_big_fil_rev_8_21_14_0_20_64_10]